MLNCNKCNCNNNNCNHNNNSRNNSFQLRLPRKKIQMGQVYVEDDQKWNNRKHNKVRIYYTYKVFAWNHSNLLNSNFIILNLILYNYRS